MQKVPPIHILVSQLTLTQVKVNGPQLILPQPLTLSGLQKKLGEMNWVRSWLPVETGKLDVLYDLLKGHNLMRSFPCPLRAIRHSLNSSICSIRLFWWDIILTFHNNKSKAGYY